MSRFTLEQIRSFLAVAELGSFTAAARALGRTQPAVTYHVRTLEDQLQCCLFERSALGVSLSPAGQALLPAGQSIRDDADQFMGRAQGLSKGITEELVVSVDQAFPSSILIKTASQLHDRHPQFRLALRTSILDDVPRHILHGEAELGLASMYADIPVDLHRVEVATANIALVAASTHELARTEAVTKSTLGKYLQLVPEDSTGSIALRSYAVLGSPLWHITDLSLMLNMLRAGIGFAVVPEHVVLDDIAEERLVRLNLPFPAPQLSVPPAFYLIWKSDRPLSVAAQWFVDLALA